MIESQLLSKVIDEKDFYVLRRYKVDVADFPTLGEVYGFIQDYVQENNATPDYRTVVAEFPNFEYIPEVTDTFKYLCRKLKAQTAKVRAFELLQNRAVRKFNELPGDQFVAWLKEETAKIEAATAPPPDGTNYATNGPERLQWYKESKEKMSRQFIPTPYPTLTAALGGGFEAGDYILLMAFTNRGKSWLASHIGLAAWQNGFGVLHYSPELSKRQQALRLDTLMGHFDNVKLRRGSLDNEREYLDFLKGFENLPTPYFIKTMEDLPNGLSLEVIEADLQARPEVKMVIVDGFNLMAHGKGARVRDSMTQTSRRLRQLFGRYGVAGLVVHQTPGASEKDSHKDDGETRLVKPPKLTDYSETVAVIQDAATALTFDQAQGVGRLSIEKAREPNVGLVIELNCDFNYGVIRESDVTDIF
ncbi:replicative DNA helicase [Pelotomaculum thermopropionicum SI]|uniref:Replicative DNA helicase n=1 Tax=Pelotomaculum thermopropionicum (strain DSM 13744 / JCM 10971 / SI) TaxID=370438 RepID=A5D082_PELTS|nr:replicative DNA helicase [Pelotomaculum thermopropionicum SI]